MTNDTNDMHNQIHESRSSVSSSRDFWAFRTMITPVLIQILFWISVVACIVIGAIIIKDAYGQTQMMIGLACVIFGPLVVRIYCEFLILFFRMNETLTEIKNQLK